MPFVATVREAVAFFLHRGEGNRSLQANILHPPISWPFVLPRERCVQKQSYLGKEVAIFNEQVFKKSKTNAYDSLHFRASLQRSIEFLHVTICYYFPIVITIAAICVFTKDTWTLTTHCMRAWVGN